MIKGSFWHSLGHQFQNPSGFFGRIMGGFMRLINAKPNRLAIEALDLQSSDDVLELGFGPGQALALIAQRTQGKIYGIEKSAIMMAQARQRNRNLFRQRRLKLFNGDFSVLPLPDQTVDKILAVNVVYFWRDEKTVMAECRRVLRPGGKMALYATSAGTMKRWKFAGPATHILYTAEQLRDLLVRGGFRNCKVEEVSISAWPRIQGLLASAGK